MSGEVGGGSAPGGGAFSMKLQVRRPPSVAAGVQDVGFGFGGSAAASASAAASRERDASVKQSVTSFSSADGTLPSGPQRPKLVIAPPSRASAASASAGAAGVGSAVATTLPSMPGGDAASGAAATIFVEKSDAAIAAAVLSDFGVSAPGNSDGGSSHSHSTLTIAVRPAATATSTADAASALRRGEHSGAASPRGEAVAGSADDGVRGGAGRKAGVSDELYAKLFAPHQQRVRGDSTKPPLLARARKSGSTGGAQQLKQYDTDVATCAADVDVRDEAVFSAVPIEEIGAAMLRGMGVAETVIEAALAPPQENEADSKTRQLASVLPAGAIKERLGLGATSNPLLVQEALEKAANRIRRPGDAPIPSSVLAMAAAASGVPQAGAGARDGAPTASKQSRADEIAQRKYPGVIVGAAVLLTRGRYAGRVGIVTQVDRVPGLEKCRVRVCLRGRVDVYGVRDAAADAALAGSTQVHDTEEVIVGKGECDARCELSPAQRALAVRLAEIQATVGSAPPDMSAAAAPSDGTLPAPSLQGQSEHQGGYRASDTRLAGGNHAGEVAAGVSSAAPPYHQQVSDAVTGYKRPRGFEVSDSRSHAQAEHEHRGAGGRHTSHVAHAPAAHSTSPLEPDWLHSGIRVRIVDDEWQRGRYFKCKAVIQDVTAPGRCSLLYYRDDGSTKIIEHVPARVLASALPKIGGAVMVLQGRYRGTRGVLIERDGSNERATVRLVDGDDEGRVVRVAYDDVAEYVLRE